MREPLLIANWKLNGTKASVKELLRHLKEGITKKGTTTTPQVVLLPPFIFMQQVADALEKSPILWGGQNMADYPKGAYTGEISADMLRDFGCQYVLLGHSERRRLYQETDEQIARKLTLSQRVGLIPILCLGETWEDYQKGEAATKLLEQLDFYLTLGLDVFKNLIIAYEPIWAIGTGKSPTPLEVEDIHQRLRTHIAKKTGFELAERIRILYGGSVQPDNAKALFAMPNIDGGLIGSAALSKDMFLQIYASFSEQ